MTNSGKSHTWKQIQQVLPAQIPQATFSFDYASSDELRGKETQFLMEKNGKLSKDKAFELSGKKAIQAYNAECLRMVKETASMKPGEVRVIYFDKNHPIQGGLDNAIDTIDSNMPPNVPYQKTYLSPLCRGKLVPPNYPFSYTFLAQCLHNGANRSEHETLDNSDLPKLFGIMLMFFNLNRGFTSFAEKMEQKPIDFLMRLPMTNETLRLDEGFTHKINRVISQIPNRGLISPDNQLLLELIDLVKQNGHLLGQHNDPAVLSEAIVAQFKQIITSVKKETSARNQPNPENSTKSSSGVQEVRLSSQKPPLYLAISV
mmetsp:Transcript_18974/g.32415  ORF Transcript_18974/g.32415 Transcript_18974/m.32415 type:complete len:316 (-) Transcript_18974:662-1609(-)